MHVDVEFPILAPGQAAAVAPGRGIPTLVLPRGGTRVVARRDGLIRRDELETLLTEAAGATTGPAGPPTQEDTQ